MASIGYLFLGVFCMLIQLSIWSDLFLFVGLIAIFRGRGGLSLRHANWVMIGFVVGMISFLASLLAVTRDPNVISDPQRNTALYILAFSTVSYIAAIYFLVYNVYPRRVQLTLNIGFGIIITGSAVNLLLLPGSMCIIASSLNFLVAVILIITAGIYKKAAKGWRNHSGGYSKHNQKLDKYPLSEDDYDDHEYEEEGDTLNTLEKLRRKQQRSKEREER